MWPEEEKSDEFGDPNDGVGVRRAGSGDENLGTLGRLGRAEGKRCEGALNKRKKGIFHAYFVSLQEVVVEGGM